MSQPEPGSVIRIAIALATLKHKPRDQSTASYLLDLHSRFPLTTKDGTNDREWRTYALELEKKLAALKAQRDTDQELLSKLRTDASQITSASDPPPPKKKSKKNPTKDQHDPEWSWDQSRAEWSRILSSQYPSSPSLVATYASLKGALSSPNADISLYASRLTDAILRALDTVHVFLFSAPNPRLDSHVQTTLGAPLQPKPEHIDSARIALASPLLMYVLQSALHTLVRTVQDSTRSKRQRQRPQAATVLASADAHTCVDKVLDCLLERVLLYLLRALAPLCSARLASLLSTPLRKDKEKTGRSVGKGKEKEKDKGKDKDASSASVDSPKKTDIRTDVFALIGTSLDALDALPPFSSLTSGSRPCGGGNGSIAGDVRDRLGLETIRELEILYAIPPPPPTPSSTQQPPAVPSSTPLSAPSQSYSQPQLQVQQQRVATESHAKRLERLTGTRAERVKALATRDAGWFLASTLNLCITDIHGAASHDPGIARNSGGLLREALLERIGKLVRSVPGFGGCVVVSTPDNQQQSSSDTFRDDPANSNTTDSTKFAIDPVCRNMLLAICERAMSRLAPS